MDNELVEKSEYIGTAALATKEVIERISLEPPNPNA